VEREQTTTNRPSASHTRAWLAHLDRQELAAVFAGGFIGAIARAALSEELPARAGHWPWATFAVNLLGALLLGLFITQQQGRPAPSRFRRSFLGSGVCGALTTFSTMMVELLKMVQGAHWALAVGYALASVGGGLAAVALSTKAVRRTRLAR
jgi:fluoride exporter